MHASRTSTDTLRQAQCMARNSPGLWRLALCPGFMAVCIVVSGCAPSQPTSETSPPRPKDQLALLSQTAEETHRKSAGCLSCHGPIETPSMHTNPAVQAGCADCHGGTASVFVPAAAAPGSAAYEQAKTQAHVQPRFPHAWRSLPARICATLWWGQPHSLRMWPSASRRKCVSRCCRAMD